MRAPTRFVALPLLAVAVLAGIGAAQLVEVARARKRRAAGGVSLLVLLASVALIVVREPRGPWPLAPAALSGPLGAVDRFLRDNGEPGPVLELPAMSSIMDGRAILATGRYMVGSTLHWMPLVNGYSGHPPASDRLLMTLAQRLPDVDALDALCALARPRWLVVHFGQMAPGEEERWTAAQAAAGLAPAARFGKTVVYRVERECASRADALLRQLAGTDLDHTLNGIPQGELSAADARGSISGELPATLPAGAHFLLWLAVRNAGSATWPGLSVAPRGTVEIQGRWRDAQAGEVFVEGDSLPLGRDLRPGETMLAQVNVLAPKTPGDYVLEVALKQDGHGWFDDLSGEDVALRGKIVVTAEDSGARATAAR